MLYIACNGRDHSNASFLWKEDGNVSRKERADGLLCVVCTILIFSVQGVLHELSCPNYANATEPGGEANAFTLFLMYIINACVFRDGKSATWQFS